MTKTYTFYDDSWWDWPPCDCCQGGLVECYNSSDTSCNLGSAHSLEDCYVQAIKTESDIYAQDDNLWEMDIDELKIVAKGFDIRVEIIS